MRYVIISVVLLFASCGGTLKSAASGISDPTERGLMYVATAIIISAIIRMIFNK